MRAPMTIPDELLILPALSYIEDLAANKHVLVFGPDAGYAANKLAPKATRVTVMDPASVRIRYFRHCCSHLNAYFEVRRLDDTQLESESCHVIFGRMTPRIEADFSAILSEMARILHPEGLFVLLLPPRSRPGRAQHAPSSRIDWEHERLLKAAFPHLELLTSSIEVCVFVSPERRRFPSFQQDMIEPDSQVQVPMALCSKIPVVPEDRLMVRFPLDRILDPVRRRLRSNRRRIEALSRALEALPESLPPAGADDLAGVVLESDLDHGTPGNTLDEKVTLSSVTASESKEGVERPDKTGSTKVSDLRSDRETTERQNLPARERALDGTAEPGDAEDGIGVSLDGENGPRSTEVRPGAETSEPSPGRPLPTTEPMAASHDPEMLAPDTSTGSFHALEATLNLGNEGLDELDMPSPTEQAPSSPADPRQHHEQPLLDPGETPFPDPLDTPDDTDPIPPRRRRIEAAMAAPYEVLDKHTESDRDGAAAPSNEDLPPLPAPADDLRQAFLNQWDEPAPESEPESPETFPEPAPPHETGEKRSTLPQGFPAASPRPLDDSVARNPGPQKSPVPPILDTRLPRGNARGEQALLQALRKEVLEKLPSVTREDDS